MNRGQIEKTGRSNQVLIFEFDVIIFFSGLVKNFSFLLGSQVILELYFNLQFLTRHPNCIIIARFVMD